MQEDTTPAQELETQPQELETGKTVPPMELVSSSMGKIQELISSIKDSEQIQSSSSECGLCGDVGVIMVDHPAGALAGSRVKYKAAKPCECRILKRFKKVWSTVPDIYQAASLDDLKAQPHLHPNQVKAVELVKAKPFESFAFMGDFGTGKTHLFYCLMNEAARSGRKCHHSTLRGLVNTYQQNIGRSMAGEQPVQVLTADQLRNTDYKWHIFLDDIDKAKPSEYVAEQIFELIDAAVSFNHKLVWTSNLTPEGLEQHFKRVDPRFGGAIVRRLLTNTNIVEMW